jgi:hypothetical protein
MVGALLLCGLAAGCGRQAQFDRNQRAIDQSIATNATDANAPAGSK